MSGGTDVWLFGDDGAQARLDGGQWVEVRPPTMVDAGGMVLEHANLYAAHAGGGDVWAVGELGTTWRLDVGSLRQVSAGRTVDLNAVSAASPSQVWAVGGYDTALQVGRTMWSEWPQCPGQPVSVWAEPTGEVQIMTRFDGGCTRLPNDTKAAFSPFNPSDRGVAILGPAPLYVIGYESSMFSGLVQRGVVQSGSWVSDGGWQTFSTPLVSGWRSPDRSETWFVNVNSVYRFSGDTSGLTYFGSSGGEALTIFGTAKADGGYEVFVAGDGGVFGRLQGAPPQMLLSGTTESILAGAGHGFDHGWMVGSRGAILEVSGINSTPRESGTDHELRGVASLPDGGVWAVGVGGTILHHK